MLDKICTDYKSSKELRKLGINLKTYFYWDRETETIDLDRMPVKHDSKTIIAAYTFEQILHLLPIHIVRKDKIDIILSLDVNAGYNSIIYANEYVDENHLYAIEEEGNQGTNYATLAARLITQINKLC